MKPVLVQSFTFSQDTVGVRIFVTKCFFERLSEWQSVEQVTMVAGSGQQWLSPPLCCPQLLTAEPPHLHWFVYGKASVHIGLTQYFVPNILPNFSFKFIYPSLSHGCCHEFTPGRVASIANNKALLGGILAVARTCKKQHKTEHWGYKPTLVLLWK